MSTTDNTNDTITKLAAAWDDITKAPGVTELAYEHYGLWTVELDGEEWAIGTDDEAEAAATDYILSSLWAFNADFIIEHSKCPAFMAKPLAEYQAKHGEDCNDDIREMIADPDEFVEDAIDADGRGHFLSQYDGEEHEATSPSGERLFLYRIN